MKIKLDIKNDQFCNEQLLIFFCTYNWESLN